MINIIAEKENPTRLNTLFPQQIAHMIKNEESHFHAHTHIHTHTVASRHRNLRQLRRLRSPSHTVTSGFSVGLRGFSRFIYFITRYIIHTDLKHTLAHTDHLQPTIASDAQVLLEDRLEATVLTWIPAEPVSHTEAGFSEQTDSQIHQPTDSGVSSPSAACSSRSSSSIRHCIHTILPHPPPSPSPPLCHI